MVQFVEEFSLSELLKLRLENTKLKQAQADTVLAQLNQEEKKVTDDIVKEYNLDSIQYYSLDMSSGVMTRIQGAPPPSEEESQPVDPLDTKDSQAGEQEVEAGAPSE